MQLSKEQAFDSFGNLVYEKDYIKEGGFLEIKYRYTVTNRVGEMICSNQDGEILYENHYMYHPESDALIKKKWVLYKYGKVDFILIIDYRSDKIITLRSDELGNLQNV